MWYLAIYFVNLKLFWKVYIVLLRQRAEIWIYILFLFKLSLRTANIFLVICFEKHPIRQNVHCIKLHEACLIQITFQCQFHSVKCGKCVLQIKFGENCVQWTKHYVYHILEFIYWKCQCFNIFFCKKPSVSLSIDLRSPTTHQDWTSQTKEWKYSFKMYFSVRQQIF